MNTARIVVLTIAVGAGGIAARPAVASDNTLPPTDNSMDAVHEGIFAPAAAQK